MKIVLASVLSNYRQMVEGRVVERRRKRKRRAFVTTPHGASHD